MESLIRDIHPSQHSEGDGRGLSVNATMNLQGSWEGGGKRDMGGYMERKREGVTVIVRKVRMNESRKLVESQDSDCTSQAGLNK